MVETASDPHIISVSASTCAFNFITINNKYRQVNHFEPFLFELPPLLTVILTSLGTVMRDANRMAI